MFSVNTLGYLDIRRFVNASGLSNYLIHIEQFSTSLVTKSTLVRITLLAVHHNSLPNTAVILTKSEALPQ